MTYHRKQTSMRAAMGSTGNPIADQLQQWAQQAGIGSNPCLEEANTKVAGLDRRRFDLIRTWQPTGFYRPPELYQAAMEVMAMLSKASTDVANAPRSTGTADTDKQNALNDIRRQFARAKPYIDAYRTAVNSGATVIDAPGFKTWVTDSMGAVSHALVTAALLGCEMPWLATMIIIFQSKFDVIAAVVKRMAAIVVKVGDVVLSAADAGVTLAKFIPWAAIGVGALFAYRELKQRKLIP